MKSEKKSKKKLILPIFLALIMVMSIFGGFFGFTAGNNDNSNPSSFDIGDSKFTFQDGVYRGSKSNLNFYVLNDPREINEYIPFEVSEIFTKEKIYLSYNPKENTQKPISLLYNNLKPYMNIFLACSVDVEGCNDMPIKICNDVEEKVGIIVLESGDKNNIEVQNGCAVINGDSTKSVSLVDALILKLFGVK